MAVIRYAHTRDTNWECLALRIMSFSFTIIYYFIGCLSFDTRGQNVNQNLFRSRFPYNKIDHHFVQMLPIAIGT